MTDARDSHHGQSGHGIAAGQRRIAEIREPIILANILVPPGICRPCHRLVRGKKRGAQKEHALPGRPGAVVLRIADVGSGDGFLSSRLKSCSRGFASFEYDFVRHQAGPFVRLDLMIKR